jgi:hypothetical protein
VADRTGNGSSFRILTLLDEHTWQLLGHSSLRGRSGTVDVTCAMNALTAELFGNLREARVILESWCVEYNERRPQSEYAGRRTNRFDGGCARPNLALLTAAGVRGNPESTPQGGKQTKTKNTKGPAEVQL